MKKRIYEIAVQGNSKHRNNFRKVITYGYESENKGIAITLDIDEADILRTKYKLTHIKTGFCIVNGNFDTIKKAKNIVNMFFKTCNCKHATKEQMVTDQEVKTQYQKAMEYLNRNWLMIKLFAFLWRKLLTN